MIPLILSLTLLWTPAQDADGYRIYAIDQVGAPWALLEDIGPQTPAASGYIEYVIPDPAVLTLYQIRAYNVAGEIAQEHIIAGYDPETGTQMPHWHEPKVGTKARQ